MLKASFHRRETRRMDKRLGRQQRSGMMIIEAMVAIMIVLLGILGIAGTAGQVHGLGGAGTVPHRSRYVCRADCADDLAERGSQLGRQSCYFPSGVFSIRPPARNSVISVGTPSVRPRQRVSF